MHLEIDDGILRAEALVVAKQHLSTAVQKHFKAPAWNERAQNGYLVIQDAVAAYVRSEAFISLLAQIIDAECRPTIEATVREFLTKEVKKALKEMKAE